MFKIRRSRDRLIFNMGIPIPDKKTSLYWDGAQELLFYFTEPIIKCAEARGKPYIIIDTQYIL